MDTIHSKDLLPVKRLNGMCNTIRMTGDVNEERTAKMEALFRALEIPETRFHDVVFENPGIQLVDVSRIFPLFHLDENDPRNYVFGPTDYYLARARELGGELEFRFGEQIEHQKMQFQVQPPPDPEKWARICLNIARHYNAGWADGFHWGLRRFSVWEEPDNDKLLAGSRQGNYEKFYLPMYAALARLLKAEWPDCQVGGPNDMGPRAAFAHFLDFCAAEKLPLDFAAYTTYQRSPEGMCADIRAARQLLDERGFTRTELEISEWHLAPDSWTDMSGETGRKLIGIESAAYTAAVLIAAQDEPVDHMFYYAAFVSVWAIMDVLAMRPYPVYHALRAFAEVAHGKRVAALPLRPAEGVYALATVEAADKGALLVSCYKKAGDIAVPLPEGLCPTEVLSVPEPGDPVPAEGWSVTDGQLRLKSDGYAVFLARLGAGDARS